MELVELRQDRLVLEQARGGASSSLLAVLGRGAGYLFCLIGGLLVLWALLRQSATLLITASMPLALGIACVAAFKDLGHKLSRESRITITAEGEFLEETFGLDEALEDSRRVQVGEGSFLVGRKRVVKLPNAGSLTSSNELIHYDTVLVAPDGGEYRIDISGKAEETLLRLSQVQKLLNLPIRLEGFPDQLEPEKVRRSFERLKVTRTGDYGKNLDIRVKPSFGEVMWSSGVAFVLALSVGLASFWQYHFGKMAEDSFTLIAVFSGASVAMILLRAVLLTKFRVEDHLQISREGLVWKRFGEEPLEVPLDSLEAMVLHSDRLLLFFPEEVRALLPGFSESHKERCYLYEEIVSTLEARGLKLPEPRWVRS